MMTAGGADDFGLARGERRAIRVPRDHAPFLAKLEAATPAACARKSADQSQRLEYRWKETTSAGRRRIHERKAPFMFRLRLTLECCEDLLRHVDVIAIEVMDALFLDHFGPTLFQGGAMDSLSWSP